jgi:hypothetical protein
MKGIFALAKISTRPSVTMNRKKMFVVGVVIGIALFAFLAPVFSTNSCLHYTGAQVPYLCPRIDGSLTYLLFGTGGSLGPLDFGHAFYRVVL